MFNLRNRAVMLLAVLVTVLALVPSVAAQDEINTFGLSTEDFTLWTSANATSAAAGTYGYSFQMDVSVTAGGTPVGMNLTGIGQIGTTDFNMVLNGSVDQLGPVDMEIRVVDSTIYVSNVAPDVPWVSITDAELQQLSDTFGSQLPVDPNAIAGDPNAATEALGLDDEAMNNIMMGLMTFDPNAYFSLTRMADEGGLAVIQGSADLAGLAASDLVQSAVAAGGEGTLPPDAAAQLNAAVAGSTANFTQYIDTTTNQVQRAVLRLALSGDAAVDFTFDVSVTEYGPTVDLTAPEGAVPLTELLEGMGLTAGM